MLTDFCPKFLILHRRNAVLPIDALTFGENAVLSIDGGSFVAKCGRIMDTESDSKADALIGWICGFLNGKFVDNDPGKYKGNKGCHFGVWKIPTWWIFKVWINFCFWVFWGRDCVRSVWFQTCLQRSNSRLLYFPQIRKLQGEKVFVISTFSFFQKTLTTF